MGLSALLSILEGQLTPVAEQQITDAGLQQSHCQRVIDFLVQWVGGDPTAAFQVPKTEGKHVLEIWRSLANFCDPSTDERNHAEGQAIPYPPRVRKYSEVANPLTQSKSGSPTTCPKDWNCS